jgi:hypothetical protein
MNHTHIGFNWVQKSLFYRGIADENLLKNTYWAASGLMQAVNGQINAKSAPISFVLPKANKAIP